MCNEWQQKLRQPKTLKHAGTSRIRSTAGGFRLRRWLSTSGLALLKLQYLHPLLRLLKWFHFEVLVSVIKSASQPKTSKGRQVRSLGKLSGIILCVLFSRLGNKDNTSKVTPWLSATRLVGSIIWRVGSTFMEECRKIRDDEDLFDVLLSSWAIWSTEGADKDLLRGHLHGLKGVLHKMEWG